MGMASNQPDAHPQDPLGQGAKVLRRGALLPPLTSGRWTGSGYCAEEKRHQPMSLIPKPLLDTYLTLKNYINLSKIHFLSTKEKDNFLPHWLVITTSITYMKVLYKLCLFLEDTTPISHQIIKIWGVTCYISQLVMWCNTHSRSQNMLPASTDNSLVCYFFQQSEETLLLCYDRGWKVGVVWMFFREVNISEGLISSKTILNRLLLVSSVSRSPGLEEVGLLVRMVREGQRSVNAEGIHFPTLLLVARSS